MILLLCAGCQSLSVTGMQAGWFGEFNAASIAFLTFWWEQEKVGVLTAPSPTHNLEVLPWVLSSREAGLLAQSSRLPLARWKRLVFLTSR